jgi:hypothetical protein
VSGLIVTGWQDRTVVYCFGDHPVWESAVCYFAAEFLANPTYPFTVHWPEPDPPSGTQDGDEVDVTGALVKCPPYGAVWRLTGRLVQCPHLTIEAGYEGIWPD